jgi:DNA sulfur modification protein DndE
MSASVSKFRTSAEAEEAFRALHKKTNLPFNLLCRLAWSKSLTVREPIDTTHLEITGKEFNRYSVTGEYDNLMKALTIQHAGIRPSDEEYFGTYFKAHVDRGILMLEKELLASESIDEFWSTLLRGLPTVVDSPEQSSSPATGAINVTVGDEVGTGEPVICSINTATNPHMAVVGIPGSGKTQFILKLLADIRRKNPKVNFIFLDYAKGDVAGDKRFVRATNARVYTLPEKTIPINPFILNSYNLSSIRFSAEEKVESISSYEHLGPVQKTLLSRAIEAAYEERAGEDVQYPDFETVERHLRRLYEVEDKGEDTLTTILRKLTSFHLFPSLAESTLLEGPLYEQTLILDLHALPALRELVAFFVIEKLYRELKNAPEAPVDPKTNARELRSLLVIDEAHNYLPMNNHFLEKLIREMRSKGLAVVLLSQSPDDFAQKHFDYTELLEFVFVLKCVADRPNQIQKLIRCRTETAKMLAPRMANLPYPECFTKAMTRSGGEFTHMRAAQFHVSYRDS